jgi:hypothetical protein
VKPGRSGVPGEAHAVDLLGERLLNNAFGLQIIVIGKPAVTMQIDPHETPLEQAI